MTNPMHRTAAAVTAALALATPALAQVTSVGSAAGLLNAVAQGATYIEITNHLDLTNQAGNLPMMPAATTLAILGNCQSEPPELEGGVPLGDVPAGRCVIQTPTTLFQWPATSFGARTTWVNALHIRLTRGDGAGAVSSLLDWGPDESPVSILYLTNSTLQGDGNEGSNGLSAANVDSLVEDTTFSFHNGFAISVTGAESAYQTISLVNNTAPAGTGIIQVQMEGRARLEGVTRAGNTGNLIMIADDGSDEVDVFIEGTFPSVDTFTMENIRGLASSGSRFPTSGDPSITSLVQGITLVAPSVSDEAPVPAMAPTATAMAPGATSTAGAPDGGMTDTMGEEETVVDGADTAGTAGATQEEEAMAPVAAQDSGAAGVVVAAAMVLATCAAAVAV